MPSLFCVRGFPRPRWEKETGKGAAPGGGPVEASPRRRRRGRKAKMVTLVEEPVDVSAVFSGGRLRPTAFVWRGRRYAVRRVLGAYRARRGGSLEIHYSVVSDNPEVYELRFSAGRMSWTLVRIHGEG